MTQTGSTLLTVIAWVALAVALVARGWKEKM
jgi:hypothetical protein